MFNAEEIINVLRYSDRYSELKGQATRSYMQRLQKPCSPGSDLELGLVVEKAKSVYYQASKEEQAKWDTDCTLLLDYLDANKKSLFPFDESQPIVKSGCYVATCVYGSYDCPEVWTLRRFRDNTLGSTWYGRFFVRTYYAISPTLVKWFGETAWFKKMWKTPLDNMVRKLESKGVENTPYEDKEW